MAAVRFGAHDVAYARGPVLTRLAGSAEAVAGVAAILMMALALAAIVQGEETRIGRLEPDALLLLLLVYAGGLVAVWSVSYAGRRDLLDLDAALAYRVRRNSKSNLTPQPSESRAILRSRCSGRQSWRKPKVSSALAA